MKQELEKEKLDLISQITTAQNILDQAKDNIAYYRAKLKLLNSRLAKEKERK